MDNDIVPGDRCWSHARVDMQAIADLVERLMPTSDEDRERHREHLRQLHAARAQERESVNEIEVVVRGRRPSDLDQHILRIRRRSLKRKVTR